MSGFLLMGSLRPSIEFDLLSLVVSVVMVTAMITSVMMVTAMIITVMMVMVNTIMVMMMLEDDHDIDAQQ